jgi:D-alanine-D-alanine ligase
MGRIKVAVLMGGKSSERAVSLSTGKQVLGALDPARFDAFPVDTAYLTTRSLPSAMPALGEPEVEVPAGKDLLTGASATRLPSPAEPIFLGRNRPDVAIICLHGKFGEDGTIQGLLELLEIPYTGSGVLASALAIDKIMSKKLFAAEGIPTPPGINLKGREEADRFLRETEAGRAGVGCPVVVKPSRQGSTIGITIVHEPAGLPSALDTALEYDSEVLVEQYIEGMEITGPVLGNDEVTALPIVEIVPASGFYDYESKYTPGATEEIVPARLSPEQTRRAQELAVRSHQCLGCRGFSRTDMLVAEDGIYVLEVNTIPGMTPTSLLPRSADAAGIPFPKLVERMIDLALEGRTREASPAARA